MPEASSRRATAVLVAAAALVFGVALAQRGHDGASSTEVATDAPPTPATPDAAGPGPAATVAPTTAGTTATAVPTSPSTTAPAPTTTTTLPPVSSLQAGREPVELTTLELTPELDDHYTYVARRDAAGRGVAGLEVTAPDTNVGQGMRLAIWDPTEPTSVDQGACATWTGTNDTLQQGFVFRLAATDGGGYRLITVTKNIVFSVYWQFNVHLWDTTAPPTFHTVGSVQNTFHGAHVMPAFPWHVCARVIGDQVSVKAWLPGEAEPSWADPAAGGSVTLPPGWDVPGQAGWFAGHVPPGRTGHYDDLRTTDLTAGPHLGP